MMQEINTPTSDRKRGGWVSLVVATCLVIGSMLVTADLWRTSSTSAYLRGPVTGKEFAAFLESREDTLRTTVSDFDGLMRTAKAAGDRAMIDVLREMSAARDTDASTGAEAGANATE